MPCLTPGTRAQQAYGFDEIVERHRHRYEFNKYYRDILEQRGLIAAGMSPDGNLVEISELRDHPWMVRLPVPPGVALKAHTGLIRSSVDFIAAAAGLATGRSGRPAPSRALQPAPHQWRAQLRGLM